MIVSDKYRFVFMHIPKCAGTFVRSHLNPYNDHPEFYHDRIHPIIGKINHSHIPLSILERHFHEVYMKVVRYPSFAIIRDPYARFISSFRQHLHEFRGIHLNDLGRRDVKIRLEEVLKLLSFHTDAELLPLELIHFQRQKHYIFNKERRVVKNVYTTQQVMNLFYDLRRITHLPIDPQLIDEKKKINPSYLAIKNPLVKLIRESPRPFKGMIMKHLPPGMQDAIRKVFFTPTKEKFKDILESDYINGFIQNFYGQDIEFYSEAKGFHYQQ